MAVAPIPIKRNIKDKKVMKWQVTGERPSRNGTEIRKCKICETEFNEFKSQPRKYCSIKCGKIGKSKSISLRNLGEFREKNLIVLAKNRMIPYWAGKKRPLETSMKQSLSMLGLNKAENNGNWKGDKVGMVALHDWVKRHLGYPDTCEYCGKSGLSGNDIHWANKSREYKRDLDDWVRLCVYCHLKYDDSAFKKGLASIEHRQGCSCFRCIGRRNRDMPAMSKRTRYS